MRLIFAGTPEFARTQLQALVEAGYDIDLVLTQPDKPAGRGQKLTAPPVKQYALDQGISVLQPLTLKDATIQRQLIELKPDLILVSAYGMLLPKEVLNIPKIGCWNVHASLLPRWRGAAPIQYALLHGDQETGITLMQMDQGLDTGDMLLKASLPIEQEDTAGTLHDKLADLGAQVLLQGLNQVSALLPIQQDPSLATHAPKITKDQAHIDWHQSADTILHLIKAFNPWPIAWVLHQEEPLKIWQATVAAKAHSKGSAGEVLKVSKEGIDVVTGQGVLQLHRIQLAGKKPMLVHEILNSKPDFIQVGEFLQ